MPAVRTIHHVYATRPEHVLALLSNARYQRARCEADGDRNIEITIHDAGRHVNVERDRTIELPALVRGLVRPTNRVVESYRWRSILSGYEADYAVSARGMPGSLRGFLRLEGNAREAALVIEFQVTARVPLLANKLEVLMADGFAAYLQHFAEHVEQTLFGRASSAADYARADLGELTRAVYGSSA